MSDGPHRSLQMRPWWKEAANRADKSAFSVTECTEALRVALERELSEELRPEFLRRLRKAHEEPGLFSPSDSLHLEKVEPVTPLEHFVMDNISAPTSTELSEVDGLLNIFATACRNVVPRFNKQIEEHFLRKAGPSRARRERERLDEAAAKMDMPALARKLLQPQRAKSAPILKKKSGLDDGVVL